MPILKKQGKKNEIEKKDLQAEKNAEKVSLDDELLNDVAGGFEMLEPPKINHPFVNPEIDKLR